MLANSARRVMSFGFAATLGLSLLTGCGASSTPTQNTPSTNAPTAAADVSGTVTVSGSTALLPLAKNAADKFQAKYPKVTITTTGGGSGTGVKNVADGTSTIGMSDVKAASDYDNAGLVETDVVLAPFVFITNKDVTVTSLTKQQIADIYAGKITNWKEVGGKDEKILLVGRPDNSGSRKLVQQLVMGTTEFSKNITVQNESGGLKSAVASQPGAIGYVDLAYAKDGSVNVLKLNGVEYSKEHLQDGTYPLYGVERMYTKGQPTGAAKAFIDYILSDEFQNTVEAQNFIPIKYMKK